MLSDMTEPHSQKPVSAGRPTRSFLERRLALLKRAVVVVAVGSFAAVASLAAERSAAHGATTPSTGQTHRTGVVQDGQDYFGYSPYGDDSGSGGSLGSGSGSPPSAGSHAS